MDIKYKLKKKLRPWKAGAIDKTLWSENAQRTSVLISADEGGARAMLVDDYDGVRDAFQVPLDQLADVIGAAAKAWLERDMPGSFSIHADLAKMGSITPPPPPPPGPGGDDPIARAFLKQTFASQIVLNGVNELVDAFGYGHLAQPEVDDPKIGH